MDGLAVGGHPKESLEFLAAYVVFADHRIDFPEVVPGPRTRPLRSIAARSTGEEQISLSNPCWEHSSPSHRIAEDGLKKHSKDLVSVLRSTAARAAGGLVSSLPDQRSEKHTLTKLSFK